MSYQNIVMEQEAEATVIRLNRPEKRNAPSSC